jgi:hypothetical protein
LKTVSRFQFADIVTEHLRGAQERLLVRLHLKLHDLDLRTLKRHDLEQHNPLLSHPMKRSRTHLEAPAHEVFDGTDFDTDKEEYATKLEEKHGKETSLLAISRTLRYH